MSEAIIAAAVFAGVVAGLHKRMDKGRGALWVLAWALAFAVYAAGVVHFTVLHRDVSVHMRYELALFWSYRIAWEQENLYYWEEIVYNILLFMPLGILLPLMIQRCRRAGTVLVLGGAGSLLIEVGQLLFRIGLFEFDDIFNNVLGALLGYCAWGAGDCLLRHKTGWKKKTVKRFLPIIIVGVYFGGLYYRICGNR